MNRLEKLFNDHDELNIMFDSNMPKGHGAFIIDEQIYLNANRSYEENVCDLAEELGHYETSVGDLTNRDALETRKQEEIAQRWSYRKLVSLDDLIICYKLGLEEVWEIAEYLEVTPDFVWKSVDYYRNAQGIAFQYKGCLFVLNQGIRIYFQ